MFGRVNVTHYYNDNVRRIDHYLRLNVDNTEIVNILKKHNAPKECLYDPWMMDSCHIDYELKYTDSWGVYWDNYIGKETIIDL